MDFRENCDVIQGWESLKIPGDPDRVFREDPFPPAGRRTLRHRAFAPPPDIEGAHAKIDTIYDGDRAPCHGMEPVASPEGGHKE